jgi:hypothetical protein|tara:strand:+ start:7977 stop:8243 length:267 start_codon:yes stop_codon:yes gene_type:complete
MGYGGQGIRNNTLSFSQAGGEVIDDTAAHTGTFGAVQVINDAVIAAITMPNVTNSAGYTTITLTAGTVIYGDVSSITLTSGIVTAHQL